jgi:circadian clock protein KaiC
VAIDKGALSREEQLRPGPPTLEKARTGIAGLDEITKGGLPAGRSTLVCGGPGCGKTILALEFLVHGAQLLDEPGLFVSFEEKPDHLIENFRSFGCDLADLIAKKKLKIAHIELSGTGIVEAGAFSLDGLLIQLEHSIAEIGAKRVVLDTLETVFSALANSAGLRSEVARLLHWLRDRRVTAIVTGERGKEQLTQHGFEEYISDCVLVLDHRVSEQTSKRRLRIIKYRGSGHAADEFPFFIGNAGFSVIPITSLNLDYGASLERVETGVEGLDPMLGNGGYYRASSVIVTGNSGTGKSSLAAAFAHATCKGGERCLYFSFEESVAQVTRNMKSVGLDLEPFQNSGLLKICSFRPTFSGLEEHLAMIAQEADRFNPVSVVLDPITSFAAVGDEAEVKSMLTRVLDLLKRRGITVFTTALVRHANLLSESEVFLSSLVDTWIELELKRIGKTRRRTIHIIKSRGMEHSHEVREYVMSSQGLSVRPLTADL